MPKPKGKMMNILEKIALRTVEKDGCTVRGGKHNHGHPQIWHEALGVWAGL